MDGDGNEDRDGGVDRLGLRMGMSLGIEMGMRLA